MANPKRDDIQAIGVAGKVKHAAIDIASSGDNTVVAAVSGKKLRVVSINFVCATAVTVTIKSGASTSLTGGMAFGANGGIAPGIFPDGHFETAAGEAFVMNLSDAVSVDGWLKYVEV